MLNLAAAPEYTWLEHPDLVSVAFALCFGFICWIFAQIFDGQKKYNEKILIALDEAEKRRTADREELEQKYRELSEQLHDRITKQATIIAQMVGSHNSNHPDKQIQMQW